MATDSLSQTTCHISTKLPRNLSDKLQIALSRIAATTARSRTYLTAALELKSRQSTSSLLLSAGFKEEIAQFQKLMGEKEKFLDELWVGWVECVKDIEILGRDEGILKRKNDSISAGDQQTPGGALDDEEFNQLIEEIKTVGRAWVKKMEDSEKVRILFRILTSLSAYLFVWTFANSLVTYRKSRTKFCSSNSLLQKFSFDLETGLVRPIYSVKRSGKAWDI
ncbi:hypothetical protein Q9L58_001843 [Maublancomyces gigas]|uniref:Uncharacterized protein n=1 Tax=Discina gigas TaxID=1032678 RepID=A0ABR3GTA5_9PEZI